MIVVFEKAVSQNQQQLFGIVHSIQKGELSPSKAGPVAKKLARTMKKKDVKDFAETKHKGLPNKVPKKESANAKYNQLHNLLLS